MQVLEKRQATCGCAPSLCDEVGICQQTCCTQCARWTTCSGFSIIATEEIENAMKAQEAKIQCKNNKGEGWRIPTITEVECICKNKASVPGGLNEIVWTTSLNTQNKPLLVRPGTCERFVSTIDTRHYVRCVKE